MNDTLNQATRIAERFHEICRNEGAEYCEIYWEWVPGIHLSWKDRLSLSQQSIESGVSIRIKHGKTWHSVHGPEISQKQILKSLFHKHSTESDVVLRPSPCKYTWASVQDAFENLLRKDRILLERNSACLELFAKKKFFSVLAHNGNKAHGTEDQASVDFQWALPVNMKNRAFSQTWIRKDPKLLLESLLNEESLSKAIHQARSTLRPWPAPKGELPVVWSARALSKLLLPLLRSFEGDLVVRDCSLLSDWPELEVPFRILETAAQAEVDVEGCPRKPLTLLDKNRPLSVLTDRRIAQKLSVAATGNTRRQSYQWPPAISPFSCAIEPIQSSDANLLAQVDRGLYVEDLELLYYEPSQPILETRLTHTYLIHQGKLGEAVAPVDMQVNLFDLLKSLKAFSSKRSITGVMVEKAEQKLLTEIHSPQALSHRINIPGSVPPEHYW